MTVSRSKLEGAGSGEGSRRMKLKLEDDDGYLFKASRYHEG